MMRALTCQRRPWAAQGILPQAILGTAGLNESGGAPSRLPPARHREQAGYLLLALDDGVFPEDRSTCLIRPWTILAKPFSQATARRRGTETTPAPGTGTERDDDWHLAREACPDAAVGCRVPGPGFRGAPQAAPTDRSSRRPLRHITLTQQEWLRESQRHM
jgi:hypothetical protein